MKFIFLAGAVLSLTSGTAFAGEANGDLFPFAVGKASMADVPTSPMQMTGDVPANVEVGGAALPALSR